MLVLRLQRTGRRNSPAFRLVVTEKSAPMKGKVTEYLGHYLPTRNPHVFEYKEERITHWISKGAQPSDTVARLLHRAGVKGTEKFIKKYTKQQKRKKGDAPAAESAPAVTPDAPPTEPPAEKEAPATPPKEEGKKPEEAQEEKSKEVKAEAQKEPPQEEKKDDKEDKKE